MKQLYFDVFDAKSDYVPLVVQVWNNDPGQVRYTEIECREEPQKAIDNYLTASKYVKEVGSDWVPNLESEFTMTLVPSVFGAEIYTAPGGFCEARPFIDDINDIYKFKDVDIYGGLTEKAIRHLRFLRDNKPDGVEIQPTRFMSPLDSAVVMRGGNFYLDLLENPTAAADFLEMITDVTVRLIHVMKNEIGQPVRECVGVRGTWYNGQRFSGDAIVNLSPECIKK